MSNQFIPNSFQVPNAFVDLVMGGLSRPAITCYLVIIRKTIGWHKEFDSISASQFMQFCGIKKADTVYSALAELERFDLVVSISQKGSPKKYKINLTATPVNGVPPVNGVTPTPVNGVHKVTIIKTNKNNINNAHAEACATKPAYKPKAKAAKKSDAMQADLAALENLGVESQTAKDWLVTRKEKRAGSLTQTVLTALQREASKAGLTVAQAVQVAAERNWARFVASYLQRESQGFAGAPSRPVNKINAVPKHTGGGVYLAKDVL